MFSPRIGHSAVAACGSQPLPAGALRIVAVCCFDAAHGPYTSDDDDGLHRGVAWQCWPRCAGPGRWSGACRIHSASNASTPLPWAAAFAQQKIFQDQCPIAGSERRAANSAPHFAVSGLWSSYRFDDLIKRGTAWALEK